jgi:methylated-DNA-[protein]-cysteine S-methyltransferase
MFSLSSVSSLLLLIRPTAILQRHSVVSKTNPMTLTTDSKRKSSSLDATVGDHDDADTKKSLLTDLQIQQSFLLSNDGDHNEISNVNASFNSKKVASLTPFQRKVYMALCLVPEGYVTTYQSIGKYIQCSSSQAIGQALKRNPYAPIIPCHRVVKSNGMIGGFHGHTSGEHIARKISLLRNEGVEFIPTKINASTCIDPKCFFDFASNSNTNPVSNTRKKRKTIQ